MKKWLKIIEKTDLLKNKKKATQQKSLPNRIFW